MNTGQEAVAGKEPKTETKKEPKLKAEVRMKVVRMQGPGKSPKLVTLTPVGDNKHIWPESQQGVIEFQNANPAFADLFEQDGEYVFTFSKAK